MSTSSNVTHFSIATVTCRFVPKIKCPVCKKNGLQGDVISDGWNANGPRRVINTHGHYYIWSKRHRCRNHHGLDRRELTFQGYDPEVVANLPGFIREQFPCINTRRAAIDKECYELIMTLFQEKMGALTIERLLEELNAHRFYCKTEIFTEFIRAWNDRCTALKPPGGSHVGR